MPTEIADAPRLEAMAMCRGAPLAIEDAGDHGIGTLADAAKGESGGYRVEGCRGDGDADHSGLAATQSSSSSLSIT